MKTAPMKKTIVVVAAIAGYCFFEISIALLTIVSARSNLYRYSPVLLLPQFVLIPGTAVIFSRLIYGRRGWIRRAAFLFAAGLVWPFAAMILFVAIVFPMAMAAEVSAVLGILTLVLLLF